MSTYHLDGVLHLDISRMWPRTCMVALWWARGGVPVTLEAAGSGDRRLSCVFFVFGLLHTGG